MNKNKPKVAIDLDDVLAPFVPTVIEWHNNKYGSSYQFSDFITMDFYTIWGGTKEEAVNKVLDYFTSKIFLDMEPLPGAKEAILKLSQQYNLAIVTSRQTSIKNQTADWVNRHFPGCFEDILHGSHFYDGGVSLSKAEMCKQMGASIIIDDLVAHTTNCADNGIKAYLFGNYPWNENYSANSKVERVNGWDDLLDELL